jgi:hypothetical protein
MTGKTFLNRVADGHIDAVRLLLNLLRQTRADYCVIGDPAVNASAEPAVSLDREQASERPGGYPADD